VLLDEPFSNLDAALRARVRAEVREILTRAGATAVFVTHDQEEALSLADRIAVMDRGRLLQVDMPSEIYARPVDAFVASFVGDADVVPGESDGAVAVTSIGPLPVASGSPVGRVDVVLRPESVRLWLDGTGIGVVHNIEYFGHDQLVEVAIDAGAGLRVRARLGAARVLVPGDRVSVAVVSDVLAFAATNGRG
jgi:iron(III) transport system ATP-binding protein